jgi:hypothetical protein
MRPMLLIRGKPVHSVPGENPVDGRPRHGDFVESLQIVRNLAGTEVVRLPEIDDLAHDGRGRCARRSVRGARPIVQARRAELVEATFPLVVGLAGDSEMPTGARHTAGRLIRPLQHLEPPRPQSRLLGLRHCVSVSMIRPTKTPLTLPVLRPHRTRPQDLGNYKPVPQAPTALIFCSKNLNPNRREPDCQPCLGISQFYLSLRKDTQLFRLDLAALLRGPVRRQQVAAPRHQSLEGDSSPRLPAAAGTVCGA